MIEISQQDLEYWEELTPTWQIILKSSAKIPLDKKILTKEDLKPIFNISHIDLKNTGVKDLEPLINNKFTKLKILTISPYINETQIEKLRQLNKKIKIKH